jgi:ABC-type Zn uptake system ZnuABC Zn-binding protein ZnuA
MKMRYRNIVLALAVVLLASLPTQAKDKLRVVTTLTDLKSIAEFIGGDKVDAFAIATRSRAIS